MAAVMKAWQLSSEGSTFDGRLQLRDNVARPLPNDQPDPKKHLIKVLSTALNPVDYKPAETPYVGRFAVAKNVIPGFDIAGRVVIPAQGSSLKPGDLVFGAAASSPLVGGGLAEYCAAPSNGIARVPSGVSAADASTVPIADLTAYQSIVPYVKTGDHVFLNGGSGGCGIFGIQIAKIKGCSVTVTCSTKNVELCKSLGADFVIDYSKDDVLARLAQGTKADLVVDNVGSNKDLFWKAHTYTSPKAQYIIVGAAVNVAEIAYRVKAMLLPGMLGGAKRPAVNMGCKTDRPDELSQIAQWMAEGKLKAIIDQSFAMTEAPDAYRKLKTGRAVGKIVVTVSKDEKS